MLRRKDHEDIPGLVEKLWAEPGLKTKETLPLLYSYFYLGQNEEDLSENFKEIGQIKESIKELDILGQSFQHHRNQNYWQLKEMTAV